MFVKYINHVQVDFFWINRDQKSFEWFVKLLSQLEIEQAEHGGAMSRSVISGSGKKCNYNVLSSPGQVPRHAHVRHLGPPEDGHEGSWPAAGAGPAAREGK